MNSNTITQAWLDYCNNVLGDEWTVTLAESLVGQDAPRPNGPYITLKIISGPRKLTLDDEVRFNGQTEGDSSFSLVGQRAYTLSIQAFRSGHSDALELLSTCLDDPDHYEELKARADIAITNRGDVIDISGKLETGWESRSSIDIIFNSSNNKPIGIGILEGVKISGELETETGKIINANIPEINKE